MKRALQIFIPLIIVLLILLFWQQQSPQHFAEETNEPISKIIMVKFEFDNEEPVQLQYPYQNPEQSLLTITQNIAQEQNWDFSFEDYGDMGFLVTKIKDYENGTAQKYWQYFADFKQPLISVDKYYPQPGQLIEWKFEKSKL